MTLFCDALFEPSRLTESDLTNYHYFGVEAVAFDPLASIQNFRILGPILTTADFLNVYSSRLEYTTSRLTQAQICAKPLICLDSINRPHRWHADLLEQIEASILNGAFQVCGIGHFRVKDASTEGLNLLESNLQLAQRLDLPLSLILPKRLNVSTTFDVLDWLQRHSNKSLQDFKKIIFHRVDETMIPSVLDAGYMLSLSDSAVLGDLQVFENRLEQVVFASQSGYETKRLVAIRTLIHHLTRQNDAITTDLITKAARSNFERIFGDATFNSTTHTVRVDSNLAH